MSTLNILTFLKIMDIVTKKKKHKILEDAYIFAQRTENI